MSIEATALDFPPPFIALQSAHVLQALIEYPSTLPVLYALYRCVRRRTFAAPVRWVRSAYDRARRRFGRTVLVLGNMAIVSNLVYDALPVGNGVQTPLSVTVLILVTTRNGNYYAVERQDNPPDGRPTAHVVPFISVDFAQVRRMNRADIVFDDLPPGMMLNPMSPGVTTTELPRPGSDGVGFVGCFRLRHPDHRRVAVGAVSAPRCRTARPPGRSSRS